MSNEREETVTITTTTEEVARRWLSRKNMVAMDRGTLDIIIRAYYTSDQNRGPTELIYVPSLDTYRFRSLNALASAAYEARKALGPGYNVDEDYINNGLRVSFGSRDFFVDRGLIDDNLHIERAREVLAP